jgi:acyl-CoA thioesterase-1
VSFIGGIRRSLGRICGAPRAGRARSYGNWAVLVQVAALAVACLFGGDAAAADKPVKLVVLKARGLAAEVADAGVSGDTATGGLARIDWSVPDDAGGVIVALGGNDMLRGVDPDVTRGAIDGILQRLKERRIPVLFAGMRAAPNLGADYVARFDALFPALAKAHEVLFHPFFLEGVAAQPTLNQRDGIHPSAAGVDKIVAGILPKVEELLQLIQKKRPS